MRERSPPVACLGIRSTAFRRHELKANPRRDSVQRTVPKSYFPAGGPAGTSVDDRSGERVQSARSVDRRFDFPDESALTKRSLRPRGRPRPRSPRARRPWSKTDQLVLIWIDFGFAAGLLEKVTERIPPDSSASTCSVSTISGNLITRSNRPYERALYR